MEEHDDYLTSLALGLFFGRNMEIFKEQQEDNKGILFKDFIKQHLKRENELENEISQLKARIKSTATPTYNRLYNIFVSMRNHIEVKLVDGVYKFSVDNCPISNDDADFISRQIMNADFLQQNIETLKTAGIYKPKSFQQAKWGFVKNDPTKITSIFDY